MTTGPRVVVRKPSAASARLPVTATFTGALSRVRRASGTTSTTMSATDHGEWTSRRKLADSLRTMASHSGAGPLLQDVGGEAAEMGALVVRAQDVDPREHDEQHGRGGREHGEVARADLAARQAEPCDAEDRGERQEAADVAAEPRHAVQQDDDGEPGRRRREARRARSARRARPAASSVEAASRANVLLGMP